MNSFAFELKSKKYLYNAKKNCKRTAVNSICSIYVALQNYLDKINLATSVTPGIIQCVCWAKENSTKHLLSTNVCYPFDITIRQKPTKPIPTYRLLDMCLSSNLIPKTQMWQAIQPPQRPTESDSLKQTHVALFDVFINTFWDVTLFPLHRSVRCVSYLFFGVRRGDEFCLHW